MVKSKKQRQLEKAANKANAAKVAAGPQVGAAAGDNATSMRTTSSKPQQKLPSNMLAALKQDNPGERDTLPTVLRLSELVDQGALASEDVGLAFDACLFCLSHVHRSQVLTAAAIGLAFRLLFSQHNTTHTDRRAISRCVNKSLTAVQRVVVTEFTGEKDADTALLTKLLGEDAVPQVKKQKRSAVLEQLSQDKQREVLANCESGVDLQLFLSLIPHVQPVLQYQIATAGLLLFSSEKCGLFLTKEHQHHQQSGVDHLQRVLVELSYSTFSDARVQATCRAALCAILRFPDVVVTNNLLQFAVKKALVETLAWQATVDRSPEEEDASRALSSSNDGNNVHDGAKMKQHSFNPSALQSSLQLLTDLFSCCTATQLVIDPALLLVQLALPKVLESSCAPDKNVVETSSQKISAERETETLVTNLIRVLVTRLGKQGQDFVAQQVLQPIVDADVELPSAAIPELLELLLQEHPSLFLDKRILKRCAALVHRQVEGMMEGLVPEFAVVAVLRFFNTLQESWVFPMLDKAILAKVHVQLLQIVFANPDLDESVTLTAFEFFETGLRHASHLLQCLLGVLDFCACQHSSVLVRRKAVSLRAKLARSFARGSKAVHELEQTAEASYLPALLEGLREANERSSDEEETEEAAEESSIEEQEKEAAQINTKKNPTARAVANSSTQTNVKQSSSSSNVAVQVGSSSSADVSVQAEVFCVEKKDKCIETLQRETRNIGVGYGNVERKETCVGTEAVEQKDAVVETEGSTYEEYEAVVEQTRREVVLNVKDVGTGTDHDRRASGASMREGQDQREVRTAVRDEVEGGAVAMEVDDDAEEEENQLAEHDVQQPSEQANIEPAERDQIDAEAAEESGEEGDISLGSAADSSKQGDAASPCSAKSASSSSDKKVKSPVAVCAADEAKQQDGVYFAPEQPPLEQAGAERSADVAKNVVPTTAGAVEEQMSSSVNFARSEENGALSPIPEENSSASRLSPVTPGAGQKNGDVGIFAEIQHKRDSQSEKKSARSGGSPDIEQQRQASTPSLAERVPSGATPVFAEGVSSSPVAEGGSTPVLLSQDAQPEEMSASNQQPPRSPASPARTQILEGEQQQPVALTQELSPEKEEAHQEPDVTSHPNVVVQQKSTTTSTAPIVLDETEHSAEGSVLKKIEAQVQAEMAEERRIKEERLRKERQEQEARPRVSQVDLAPKRNSPGKNSFVGSRGSSGSSSRIITEEEALAIAAQRRAAERKAEQDRRAEAEKEKEQAPEVAAQADVVEQEDVEMQDAPAVDERVASSSAVVSTSTGAEQNRPATPEEGPQAAGAPATQASLQSDKDRLWDQLGSESESELPPLCTDGPDAE